MLFNQNLKRIPRSFVCSVKYITKHSSDTPFSQTPAFEPLNTRTEYSSIKPIYIPNYFDSLRYKLIRCFSFFGSIGVVFIYIAFFREKNDIDELLETSPSLLYANLTKRHLNERIKLDKLKGKNTSLLEAELEHVNVKKAVMRANLEKS